ncbi:MAG: CIA30 family protein [Akkermansiaceae bacterium]|nr:CIA30 family protein [Akkermansiaceae bacterium]
MNTRKYKQIKQFSAAVILGLVSATVLMAQQGDQPQGKETKTTMLIDFANKDENHSVSVVNDGVMGGLSQGNIKLTQDNTLLFKGLLSLRNNGGFSSFRISGQRWDLRDWKGIEIHVRGDGRVYGLRATTDEKFLRSSVSFTADFETTKDKWVKLQIPFSSMKASWRGRKLNRNFNPAEIKGLGIILADKKAGEFALEIKSISAWK